MANNEKLLPSVDFGACPFITDGCQGVCIKSQPVAVEGLPERKRDSCEDSDVLTDIHNEGWNACLAAYMPHINARDARIAELEKKNSVFVIAHHQEFQRCEKLRSKLEELEAQLAKGKEGLPARKSHHLHASFLSERDKAINETLDAVQPLVAQLRGEVECLGVNHTEAVNVAMRCQKERDALRAEVERLQRHAQQIKNIADRKVNESNTLRADKADLVGLLRDEYQFANELYWKLEDDDYTDPVVEAALAKYGEQP